MVSDSVEVNRCSVPGQLFLTTQESIPRTCSACTMLHYRERNRTGYPADDTGRVQRAWEPGLFGGLEAGGILHLGHQAVKEILRQGRPVYGHTGCRLPNPLPDRQDGVCWRAAEVSRKFRWPFAREFPLRLRCSRTGPAFCSKSAMLLCKSKIRSEHVPEANNSSLSLLLQQLDCLPERW